MDPRALRETVAGVLGRRMSDAEATRICQAARRMLVAAAPLLRRHGGDVPAQEFGAVLRELSAMPANDDD